MIELKSAIIHVFKNNSEVLPSIISYLQNELGRKSLPIRAKKTIPGFNLKKKSIVGAKITYNGKEGWSLLDLKEKKIKIKSITNTGFTIGLKEYCELSRLVYDSSNPLFGFDLIFNFSSRGSRIGERKRNKTKFKNLSTKEQIITLLREKGYEVQ